MSKTTQRVLKAAISVFAAAWILTIAWAFYNLRDVFQHLNAR